MDDKSDPRWVHVRMRDGSVDIHNFSAVDRVLADRDSSTSTVNDLVTWLRAQLDDDEATARVISAGGYEAQTWRAGPDGPGHVGVLLFADDRMIGDPPEAIETGDEPFAIVIGGRAEHAHIVRWDPARVLAEVEAKRRILDEYEGYASDDDDDHEHAQFAADGALVLESVVKLLAQPYAGRPGWREEWAAAC